MKLDERPNDVLDSFEDQLEDIGIRRVTNSFAQGGYLYTGDDPALALTKLLELDILILDYFQSIQLAAFIALNKILGPNDFNEFIKRCNKGKLSTIDPLRIFNRNLYYRSFDSPDMSAELLADIEVGDWVYIAGVKNGFAV